MITKTIQEVINYEGFQPKANIYIVRDGETVFYVGMSMRGCVSRIIEHLGMGREGMTSLGYFIKANIPASYSWQVELLEVEDYEPILRKIYPNYDLLKADGDHYFRNEYVTSQVEFELISNLGPCLNGSHNYNSKPLPERYIDPVVQSEQNDFKALRKWQRRKK
jgi:hypothetical protein